MGSGLIGKVTTSNQWLFFSIVFRIEYKLLLLVLSIIHVFVVVFLAVSPCKKPRVLSVNPLHSNISMHILLSVLCTFPKLLIRRVCLTVGDHFLYSHDHNV